MSSTACRGCCRISGTSGSAFTLLSGCPSVALCEVARAAATSCCCARSDAALLPDVSFDDNSSASVGSLALGEACGPS